MTKQQAKRTQPAGLWYMPQATRSPSYKHVLSIMGVVVASIWMRSALHCGCKMGITWVWAQPLYHRQLSFHQYEAMRKSITHLMLRWQQHRHGCKHPWSFLCITMGYKMVPLLIQQHFVQVSFDWGSIRNTQVSFDSVGQALNVFWPTYNRVKCIWTVSTARPRCASDTGVPL